jgi:hypothetical protein
MVLCYHDKVLADRSTSHEKKQPHYTGRNKGLSF